MACTSAVVCCGSCTPASRLRPCRWASLICVHAHDGTAPALPGAAQAKAALPANGLAPYARRTAAPGARAARGVRCRLGGQLCGAAVGVRRAHEPGGGGLGRAGRRAARGSRARRCAPGPGAWLLRSQPATRAAGSLFTSAEGSGAPVVLAASAGSGTSMVAIPPEQLPADGGKAVGQAP